MSDAWKLRLFRICARIPACLWIPLGFVASFVVALIRPDAIRTWADNVLGSCGVVVTRRQERRVIFSWIINTFTSLQLGRLTDDQIKRRVIVDDASLAWLRREFVDRGLVVALGHMGSWDLAGAWAARQGMPVVSVAERLPAGLFEYFHGIRQSLDIRIYPFDQPHLVPILADDSDDRVVCLLSDRNFSRTGVTVTWPGGAQSKLPAGSATVAQHSGATLIVITCYFRRLRMHMNVSHPITVAPGRAGVERATQYICEEFASAISRHPDSWLMMQPLFG